MWSSLLIVTTSVFLLFLFLVFVFNSLLEDLAYPFASDLYDFLFLCFWGNLQICDTVRCVDEYEMEVSTTLTEPCSLRGQLYLLWLSDDCSLRCGRLKCVECRFTDEMSFRKVKDFLPCPCFTHTKNLYRHWHFCELRKQNNYVNLIILCYWKPFLRSTLFLCWNWTRSNPNPNCFSCQS